MTGQPEATWQPRHYPGVDQDGNELVTFSNGAGVVFVRMPPEVAQSVVAAASREAALREDADAAKGFLRDLIEDWQWGRPLHRSMPEIMAWLHDADSTNNHARLTSEG